MKSVLTMPGVLVRIDGKGVLITGDSGCGKSDLALELLERGHQLVADDAVRIRRCPEGVLGDCPTELAGLLELRGLGIVPVERLFGKQALASRTRIALEIRLLRLKTRTAWADWPRLEACGDTVDLLGHALPRLTVPVGSGRPLPLIVETAVRYRLVETPND